MMKRLRPNWGWRERPPRWLVAAAGATAIIFLGIWLFGSRITAPIDSYAECAAAGYPVMESFPPVCRANNQNFVGPMGNIRQQYRHY